MKAKSVWMVASLAALCAASHADEKKEEAATKPAAASDYAPFVIPVPEDKSGFATKPPEGGALKMFREPKREVPNALPPMNSPQWRRMMESQAMESMRTVPRWKLTEAPLSTVLSTIEKVHKVSIVACFSPEKLSEDPKISMALQNKSVNHLLDSLEILGLVWRRMGDTYYVAWSENDLPPLQNAITPAPQ